MENKSFLQELSENSVSSTNQDSLMSRVDQFIDKKIDEHVNRLFSDLKNDILEKAKAGEFQFSNGKKIIEGIHWFNFGSLVELRKESPSLNNELYNKQGFQYSGKYKSFAEISLRRKTVGDKVLVPLNDYELRLWPRMELIETKRTMEKKIIVGKIFKKEKTQQITEKILIFRPNSLMEIVLSKLNELAKKDGIILLNSCISLYRNLSWKGLTEKTLLQNINFKDLVSCDSIISPEPGEYGLSINHKEFSSDTYYSSGINYRVEY